MTGLVSSKPSHGCEIGCSFFLKDCLSPEITLLSAGLVGSFFQGIWETVYFFLSFFQKDYYIITSFPFNLLKPSPSSYGRFIQTIDKAFIARQKGRQNHSGKKPRI